MNYLRGPAAQPVVAPYQDQPELARTIASDPVFSALAAEVDHERKQQAMKWWYTYVVTDLSDGVGAAASKPVILTIEQGTDFKCCYITGSAFSYDATGTDASMFPIPNSAGNVLWAGRGLTLRITDTRAGRDLTSGEVPFELIMTPGYGLSFHSPFPLHYWFVRNTKIRFDVRNLDAASGSSRVHYFSIALHGYKYLTPGS